MTRPCRIGIDASAMLIEKKHGYENYLTSLLLSMAELSSQLEDLELVLYFHAGNPLADPSLMDAFLPKLEGFRCRVYRCRHLFGRLLPLMAWVDRLDWIHLPVYSWSRWYPCSVGVTIHDTCGARLRQQGILGGAEPHESFAEHDARIQRLLDVASRCIVVSNSVKKDLVAFYNESGDNVSVVPHGTDGFFYHSPDDADRVKLKYGLDRYILDVNVLQVRKNHRRLFSAFAKLCEEHAVRQDLVLVGREGWGAEAIRAALDHLEIKSKVRYMGYVPRRDLRGLYSGADLVVNPSLCEGFGLPVLEAMACGAVVAISDATSLPEVGGEAALYFDPVDVESMASVIWRGLWDERLRQELQQKGRARIRDFSWQRAARDTLAAYRDWCTRAG